VCFSERQKRGRRERERYININTSERGAKGQRKRKDKK